MKLNRVEGLFVSLPLTRLQFQVLVWCTIAIIHDHLQY